ncbi:hypothetical protein QFC20_000979 [Naganishia adeliensis]|uniref:Uncharacterized protein n=1 Tax=Naganishia adeliensis TaxID=92952 RepID=A0ACC2WYR7_9TREE|nr:hypothetical protein QFC20_000979 [Naganishia adeliensis]
MQCAGSTPSNRQVSLFFLTRALRRGQVADDLPFSAPKTRGGSNALNVYYSKNYVSKLVLPKGWESLGCIAEGNQGRALISAQMDSDSMTIDMCLNYCSSKGFGMAGLEYGRQCFCAKDSLSNGASLAVTSNQWSVECCLARDGLKLTVNPAPFQLHAMPGYWNPAIASAVEEIASAVGTWRDSGLCLQEVAGRALRGAAVRSAGMTVEYCLNYCGGLGFLMAGVEYGKATRILSCTECYCGQKLEGGASISRQSGQCNMYCAGNTLQTCGGANAINYYTTNTLDVTVKLPAGWSQIGCVQEPQGHRALNVTAKSVSPIQASFMTGVACANACLSAGFNLAGTQYSQECYCGNALNVTALTVRDNKYCDYPCSGNEREMCGGAYHNTLYSATPTVPLVG